MGTRIPLAQNLRDKGGSASFELACRHGSEIGNYLTMKIVGPWRRLVAVAPFLTFRGIVDAVDVRLYGLLFQKVGRRELQPVTNAWRAFHQVDKPLPGHPRRDTHRLGNRRGKECDDQGDRKGYFQDLLHAAYGMCPY